MLTLSVNLFSSSGSETVVCGVRLPAELASDSSTLGLRLVAAKCKRFRDLGPSSARFALVLVCPWLVTYRCSWAGVLLPFTTRLAVLFFGNGLSVPRESIFGHAQWRCFPSTGCESVGPNRSMSAFPKCAGLLLLRKRRNKTLSHSSSRSSLACRVRIRPTGIKWDVLFDNDETYCSITTCESHSSKCNSTRSVQCHRYDLVSPPPLHSK